MVPPNSEDFCKGYDYKKKVDLSKGYWNPNGWIRSDSSQLFFRCHYYFASAVFVVQCISVGYQEQDVVA